MFNLWDRTTRNNPQVNFITPLTYLCSYHFNTVRDFLQTNHVTSNNINQKTFLLTSLALMMISSVYDPTFAPTFRAIQSNTRFISEQNLREIFLHVIFCLFQTLSYVYLSQLRRRHWSHWCLDFFSENISHFHQKNSPLVKPALFRASRLIRARKS